MPCPESKRCLSGVNAGHAGSCAVWRPEESLCWQAPLVDPVVAADGYTYERGSIQKHLAASRISPISGKPMGSALYDNRLVASLLARLGELPPLGSS